MNQLNNTTQRNLHEFGFFFKNSLVISFLAAVFAPLVFLTLVNPVLGVIFYWLSCLANIGVLVFKILMFVRIQKTKESDPNLELTKFYRLLIVSLIANGILIGSYLLATIQIIASAAVIFIDLVVWQNFNKNLLAERMEVTKRKSMLSLLKFYMIVCCLIAIAALAQFILGLFRNPLVWGTLDTIFVVMSGIAMVITIVLIFTQRKIARTILMIFTLP